MRGLHDTRRGPVRFDCDGLPQAPLFQLRPRRHSYNEWTKSRGLVSASVPASQLRRVLDSKKASKGNAGDALNITEAGGIGADLFITTDAASIGRVFGRSGSILLPYTGGVWVPFRTAVVI